MMGPLPRLYRWIVGVVGVLAGIGLGFWGARALPMEFVPPTGSVAGLLLGAAVVVLLLRDSGRPDRRVDRR